MSELRLDLCKHSWGGKEKKSKIDPVYFKPSVPLSLLPRDCRDTLCTAVTVQFRDRGGTEPCHCHISTYFLIRLQH